jgi:hypothetical protein
VVHLGIIKVSMTMNHNFPLEENRDRVLQIEEVDFLLEPLDVPLH